MIVYINVKDGKVDLTKEELDKLLREKYNEGYADGKSFGTITSNGGCNYNFWTCPYKNIQYTDITTSNQTITASTATDFMKIKYNEED